MEKLVSIITPVYNSGEFLNETILSVENQTYDNWELILIDDFSKDNSKEIILNHMSKDQRIKGIFLEENQGVAHARNIGIEIATGEYIAFLDSDDLWKKDKLALQLDFMDKNGVVFSYSNYELINEKGEELNRLIVAPTFFDYKKLLKGNGIGCLTVILKSDLLKNRRFLDVGHEDYILWLDILKSNVNAQSINRSLAFYRKSNNSLSGNKVTSAKWTWNIYRNYCNMNICESTYYFVHYIYKGLLKRYI